MPDARRRRPKQQTRELVTQLLDKLERIDDRLSSIETQQVLLQQGFTRQARLIEEVNQRCMERLGLQCPIDEDEQDDTLNGTEGDLNGNK